MLKIKSKLAWLAGGVLMVGLMLTASNPVPAGAIPVDEIAPCSAVTNSNNVNDPNIGRDGVTITVYVTDNFRAYVNEHPGTSGAQARVMAACDDRYSQSNGYGGFVRGGESNYRNGYEARVTAEDRGKGYNGPLSRYYSPRVTFTSGE